MFYYYIDRNTLGGTGDTLGYLLEADLVVDGQIVENSPAVSRPLDLKTTGSVLKKDTSHDATST